MDDLDLQAVLAMFPSAGIVRMKVRVQHGVFHVVIYRKG